VLVIRPARPNKIIRFIIDLPSIIQVFQFL